MAWDGGEPGRPSGVVRELSRRGGRAPARELLPRAARGSAARSGLRQLLERDARFTDLFAVRELGAPADGEPVSGCRLLEHGPFAEVDFVETHEAERGRGLGRAIVLAATATALAGGHERSVPARRLRGLDGRLVRAARLPRRGLRVRVHAAARRSASIIRVVTEIAFDEGGLVPCVVQDSRTGEVLTLAYMNAEALARTRETGEVHFWSRSRGELWHKGATSGNFLRVRALRFDCDLDAVLALVEPAGPACHTGERTCFHNGELDPVPSEALPALERTVASRRAAGAGRQLHRRAARRPGVDRRQGPRGGRRGRARGGGRVATSGVREEAADVLYHLDVLLASRGLGMADAFEELNGRRR